MTTANARHPIRVVSHYTGLSPELIRAWEKRYQAVEPTRTDTGRRLYSDQDVDRLKLLKRASDNGRRISDIAGHSSQELTELISQDRPMVAAVEAVKQLDGSEVEALRASMMNAIREHNPAALDALLYRGSLQFTTPTLMEDVVAPLLRSIGEGTREGSLRISHEHMATAQIRTFLGAMRPASVEYQEAPRVIITTPSGQLHELGALMVSVTCASEGWMPIYLGPNTPADEIASAAVASGAMAVGLSITYPADDPRLPGELRRLRRQLPDNIPIFIGGAAVRENSPLLQELHSPYLNSLHAVRDYLAELRQGIEGY